MAPPRDVRSGSTPDDDAPVFVISVAAELAGMHAQTLRQYDRLGLVTPQRTQGGGRRYSRRDVALLREVQRLSQEEGVSLAGIRNILDLRDEVTSLRGRLAELTTELEQLRTANALQRRVFAAGQRGEVVSLRPGARPPRSPQVRSMQPDNGSGAVVVWRPGASP